MLYKQAHTFRFQLANYMHGVNPLIVRAARLKLSSPNCAKTSGLSTTDLAYFGDKIAILTMKMIFYKLLAIAVGICLLKWNLCKIKKKHFFSRLENPRKKPKLAKISELRIKKKS